eukprot:CAMPEP_0182514482 /NCGR_PEP_ID=MMETSP1321-20130603/35829_1 /TAXON_ID=91990 /ORGANISM="Bolidomonas sp., Strain RCC1657" /LENGTH=71 /DNA_ID=CAMNT_0024721683 /DNA_START=84 /DNA_END=296 /DNA_ORIENTATION=-
MSTTFSETSPNISLQFPAAVLRMHSPMLPPPSPQVAETLMTSLSKRLITSSRTSLPRSHSFISVLTTSHLT